MEAEIAALKNRQVHVLGHPMYVLSAGRYVRSIDEIDEGVLEELTETAAKNHVAVEINGHFFRDFTAPRGYFDLFRMCLRTGVKLSTGTDAHQPAHVGDLESIHATLSHLRAKPSDIFSPSAKA
jgi:histidinol phosphatase-like PHP family hydrolase